MVNGKRQEIAYFRSAMLRKKMQHLYQSILHQRCFQLSLIVHAGAEIIAESVPRRVKFKGSSNNFCRIVSKNFEED